MIPSFGKLPSGKRLSRIKASNNYRHGAFQNVYDTPMLSPDASYTKMLGKFFFGSSDGQEPRQLLPSVRTDLKMISRDEPSLTWFGHSSYLITLNGKIILVDPVFSLRASPFQNIGSKSFQMTNPYTVDYLPDPDLLIITHDHYDHLDYNTITRLSSGVPRIATSLGVGAHLESWGVDSNKIREFDWWEGAQILPGLELTAMPSRHFSGRVFKRNQTIWSSFLLEGGGMKVFVGGDSGYDGTFARIGEKTGGIDFAILECGQYDMMWPNIHMMPEETVQAGVDLRAKAMMAVHWGKFRLANHPWSDPIDRATTEALRLKAPLITPQIGERIRIDNPAKHTSQWWRQRTNAGL